MERHKLLDTPSCAFGRTVAICLAAVCLLVSCPDVLRPGELPVSNAQQLYQEKRWEEVVRLAQSSLDAPAEMDYYCGMALARLERWEEARAAFAQGERKQPDDKRFPLERAGVAFKQNRNSEAKAALRRALKLDPRDEYGNNFLATIYLLEGNLEAALKYWNRIGKPQIEDVRMEPEPSTDAVLIDRAFAFSSAELLQLEDLETTKARLNFLGVFRGYRFDLVPAGQDNFHLDFRSLERRGWGSSKLDTAVSLLRGLPFQTVYPEFYNMRGSAMNFRSLARWDSQKRRAFAEFSAPLASEAKWRYRLFADLRNENWDLTEAFAGSNSPVGSLNMRTAEAGAEIGERVGGRWGWRSGVFLSHRSFRDAGFDPAWADEFLTDGFALKYRGQVDYALLRLPERRLTVDSTVRGQVGKIMRQSFDPFSKLEASLYTRWLPRARGDDYETNLDLRAGKTFGGVPFDELFQLGIERDNDLFMRGHIGTRDGRKGSAPLGRNYFLANASVTKNLWTGPGVSIGAGPFLDSGRIYDPSPNLGSKKWLWDTGAQVRLRALGGVGIVFVYGKDLRSGRNSFYAMLGR